MLDIGGCSSVLSHSPHSKHFHFRGKTKSWFSTSSVPFSKTIWRLMLRLVPKWSWRALLFVFMFVFCFGSLFRFQKLERHDTHRAKWVQIHNLIHIWFHPRHYYVRISHSKYRDMIFRQLPSTRSLTKPSWLKYGGIRSNIKCDRPIPDDKPGIETLT